VRCWAMLTIRRMATGTAAAAAAAAACASACAFTLSRRRSFSMNWWAAAAAASAFSAHFLLTAYSLSLSLAPAHFFLSVPRLRTI
jgi:hypothetical protein